MEIDSPVKKGAFDTKRGHPPYMVTKKGTLLSTGGEVFVKEVVINTIPTAQRINCILIVIY